jgi:hypothetical protein
MGCSRHGGVLKARLPAILALTTSVALGACDAVPELTFADGGATSESSTASDDATGASGDSGCPSETPDGAAVCCGSVACVGDCAGRCPECESSCGTPGTFCCAKSNNIMCRQVGMTCN